MSDLYIPVSVGVAVNNSVADDINSSDSRLGVVPVLAVASIVATAVQVGISVTSTIMAKENREEALRKAKQKANNLHYPQEYFMNLVEGYNKTVYSYQEQLFHENSYLVNALSGYSLNDKMTYIDSISSINDGILMYYSLTDYLGFYRMMENLNRSIQAYYNKGYDSSKLSLALFATLAHKSKNKISGAFGLPDVGKMLNEAGSNYYSELDEASLAIGVEVAGVGYRLSKYGLSIHIDKNGTAGIDWGKIEISSISRSIIFAGTTKHHNKRFSGTISLDDYHDGVLYNSDGTIKSYSGSIDFNVNPDGYASTTSRARSAVVSRLNLIKDRLDWSVGAGVPAWAIRAYILNKSKGYEVGEQQAKTDTSFVIEYIATLKKEREAKTESGKQIALGEQEGVITKKVKNVSSGSSKNRVSEAFVITKVVKKKWGDIADNNSISSKGSFFGNMVDKDLLLSRLVSAKKRVSHGSTESVIIERKKNTGIIDSLEENKGAVIVAGLAFASFIVGKGK